MKATASNTSRQMLTQLAQRLSLAKTFESTFGAGIMTAGYKRQTHLAGWTTDQLIAMSKANSLSHVVYTFSILSIFFTGYPANQPVGSETATSYIASD